MRFSRTEVKESYVALHISSRQPWTAAGWRCQAGAGRRRRGRLMAATPRITATRPSPTAGRKVSPSSRMPSITLNPERRKRSEEHKSELQSLMRTSYAVYCCEKKKPRETRDKQVLYLT